ncbi:glycine/betaine ABC transporter substrate-binding protein [Halanaerobiaceae bacterium Z-7014]|uniref:Glycine/betaine ABC transporter substrate-binding protein n=1 Tax=Halonatronomonas betaini TaxID=2778430 RepID=A0A931AMS1_9FIRM|nr:glycine betaine ABC transporter substrate-binding protein [Halonatronomonas betaini]MBF8435663.1 glycine/betaine ABC transporter substrate-binding protein [Halonatronomonas betaini]
MINISKKITILTILIISFAIIFTGCGNGQEDMLELAASIEFLERDDGIHALEEEYGFEFGDDNIQTMEVGLSYSSLDEEEVDVAMGFATDGRIPAFDLVILEDDKNFFPVYNPAPTINNEILEEYPELEEIINQLPPLLDEEKLPQLNQEVDIEEREPVDVAREFLEENELLGDYEDERDGPTIGIGSKAWTEQLILGNLLVELLESHGYPVDDRTGLGETPVLRNAMESGEIDLYWEYTGTVLMTVMEDEEITEAEEAYQRVKDWDEAENDIIWLDYASANNTWTLMMLEEKAEELGIESISDLADHINELRN